MRVGVLVIELFIEGASSLKEKRKVVRSFIDRCRSRFNVSVAEVEHQDLHQRAGIGFAAVADSEAPLQKLFDRILEEADTVVGSGVNELTRDIL